MKKLKIWGPWEDNPSKCENIYGTKTFLEESKKVEEQEIPEEVKNEILNEKVEDLTSTDIPIETDPYSEILKDLK